MPTVTKNYSASWSMPNMATMTFRDKWGLAVPITAELAFIAPWSIQVSVDFNAPVPYRTQLDFRATNGLTIGRSFSAKYSIIGPIWREFRASNNLSLVVTGPDFRASNSIQVGMTFRESLNIKAAVKKSFTSRFSLRGRVFRDFRASLALLTAVALDYQGSNDLLVTNPVALDFKSVNVLYDPTSEVLSHVLSVVTQDGQELDVTGLEITGDKDSYALALTMEVATLESWMACSPGGLVTVTLNGESYEFKVDTRKRSRQFGVTAYSVEGRSRTVMLDATGSAPMTKTWGDTTAQTVAQELCDAAGVELDWRILDWPLRSSSLSASKSLPIDILQRLAAAAGGSVQATPDGKVVVDYNYPTSPTRYDQVEEDLAVTDLDDILSVEEHLVVTQKCNSVSVMDKNFQTDRSVGIELDRTRAALAGQAYVRVYSNPFTELDLHTSGPAGTQRIESRGVVVEQLTETIEIVNGTGRTSKFIEELLEASYKDMDLGVVTFDGSLVTTNTVGASLLEVTYSFKYQLFLVESSIFDQVQFYTEED